MAESELQNQNSLLSHDNEFIKLVLTMVEPRQSSPHEVRRQEFRVSRLRLHDSIDDLLHELFSAAFDHPLPNYVMDIMSLRLSSYNVDPNIATICLYFLRVAATFNDWLLLFSSDEFSVEEVVTYAFSDTSSELMTRIMKLSRLVIAETTSCSICFEAMAVGSEAHSLPCSHSYHYTCIHQWLSHHDTCPLCRFKLIL
ncbi:E3 ubiquitin-protein ligase RHA2B-like [Mercurialis annua]|uniref:E3 ubiquitin-protein ligase RHA2B-like n=1 Tax=Mercurialis annua TaxID=3986 RepID=UPI00215FC0B0|nr:E3 ubiquitin-protein ligase RHA2B-like [Mercurialis annua]